MARARNIKPSLFKNEILGAADPLLTILFVSLWCLADREGRIEDRPERIKVETFPYKVDVNITNLLCDLQRSGFITRYRAGHESVIQVVNFKKHQSPHNTEKQSILPEFDSNSLILNGYENITVKTPVVNGALTVLKRPDSLIPDLLIPDSGYLIPDSKTLQKKPDPDFEKFWQIYPKRPGANKTQAMKAWLARLKEGIEVQSILYGTMRYEGYCKAMNVEPQYVKQAATFLGPDKHFMSEWAATGKRNANQDFVDRLTGRKGNDDDPFTIDG